MTEWAAGDAAGVLEARAARRRTGGRGRDAGRRGRALPASGSARSCTRRSPQCRSTRRPRRAQVLVATHGRIVGATAEEVAAAVSVVAAVLDHPLVARGPRGRARRTVPS